MNSLFITGAGGFIARNLLAKFDATRYSRVYCLSRTLTTNTEFPSLRGECHVIRGGIHQPDLYAPYLRSTDTLVHLAAATGKASRREFYEVNRDGTELLVDQCKQAGVKKFLYVSSIAARYPDKTRNPYAKSKEMAENVVQNSGLNYVIVRPTIVIGHDSAVWKSLLMLARARIAPIVGDGTTKIQPIHIEDLVDCLVSIINQTTFTDEVLELGGPEAIGIESFIRKIHELNSGTELRTVHIPAKPLIAVLWTLETFLRPILPVTTGQLSAFLYDGTIEMNAVFQKHVAGMKGIAAMLESSRDPGQGIDGC